MEQTGEMGEIGREARHEGVFIQSGADTGEHKDKTADIGKEEEFRVQVHNHICLRFKV